MLKIPKLTVVLSRRDDGTIAAHFADSPTLTDRAGTFPLRARTVRSLDEAKQRINDRLQPLCKELVYVDPPGEGSNPRC